MRDIVITLIVFGALPFVLMRPWMGILLWSWLGYMNPHRLSWGFAMDFPFSQLAAAATLVGLLFARDRRGVPLTPLTCVWFTFILWMSLTTWFALDPVEGWDGWEKAMKIQLFSLLTVMLVRSRERLVALVWVIALSLGFFGVKGGLYVLSGGGSGLVWGPPGTFIADNNALALAIIMTMPLLWYLYCHVESRLLRFGFAGAMALCAASVLGSHSRGAALAGGAMLGMLWLKGSRKWIMGAAMALIVPVLVLSMPDRWFDRMQTVTTYEQDGSAMGRIRAWSFSIDMAQERFLGGGFGSFSESNYQQYAPDVTRDILEKGDGKFQEAHSIYFKVLGDHGFVGLILFLLLGLLAYRSASAVIRQARDAPDLKWAGDLAAMCQVSLVGFAIGGAFLGLSYFDFYYHLIAIIVVLNAIVREEVPAADPAATEASVTTANDQAAMAGSKPVSAQFRT